MDIISGIGLILSLIPLFQRERDKKESASKEQFYSWLIEHKFQEVKDCITNNFALQIEIEKLLGENQETLLNRFDTVDTQLVRILHGIDGFRELAQKISPAACLSQREENLLRIFVNTGGSSFYPIYALQGFCGFRTNASKQISSAEVDEKFLTVNADVNCPAACAILQKTGILTND